MPAAYGNKILIYGLTLALLMFLLNWLEIRFLLYTHSLEIIFGAIALIFTALGIWVASRLIKPRTLIVEKEVIIEKSPEFIFDRIAFEKTGLSERELEVLREMSLGLSNQEIADKLHLSVPTIKTHASKVFEKLDVKRRTQAIEKGKSLRVIP